jgi:outer membrane protein assembly factor BamD
LAKRPVEAWGWVLANILKLMLIFSFLGCAEKELSKDPEEAFVQSRKRYDKKRYLEAIEDFNQFKARFPYSKNVREADWLIADSYYEESKYEEAASRYEHFLKMYPKDERASKAQSRIAESYWQLSPRSDDRELMFVERAVEEWQKVIDLYPESDLVDSAKENVSTAQRLLADGLLRVARFYCKQGQDHSCAYRYIRFARRFPEYKEDRKVALSEASSALQRLSIVKDKDKEDDSNLYFRDLSAEEIRNLAKKLQDEADAPSS